MFLFRSYRKPIVILLMLPLIFIGIVLGLVVLGKEVQINIPAPHANFI